MVDCRGGAGCGTFRPPAMPHPFRLQRSCPLLLLAGLFLLLALAACGGASPGSGSAAESDQEWLWLQRSKQELDQKREQLAALGPVASRPAISAASPAAPASAAPAGPAAESARLAREVETLTAELDRRLVDFVNANPPVQGEPLTRRQQAALRMKSDEDLEIARQYAQKGGTTSGRRRSARRRSPSIRTTRP